LRIEYVPLAQAVLWDRNPKRHDIGALIASIERHGFKDPPKFEPELNGGEGGFVEGNGRTIALRAMRQRGDGPPRGIAELDGDWAVPVLFGVDAPSQRAAEAYGVDHNALTMAGGDFDLTDHMRMWDKDFTELLEGLAQADELPVAFDGEDLDRLLVWSSISLDGKVVDDPSNEWEGMPEFENEENFGAIQSIKVHFATEKDIKDFSELIGQDVTMNTTYIWFPKQVRENLLAYKCEDES